MQHSKMRRSQYQMHTVKSITFSFSNIKANWILDLQLRLQVNQHFLVCHQESVLQCHALIC